MIATKGFHETEFRPDGTIWIPSEIVLEGKEPDRILRWQSGGGKFVRPKAEMLYDFMLLCRAPDERSYGMPRNGGYWEYVSTGSLIVITHQQELSLYHGMSW